MSVVSGVGKCLLESLRASPLIVFSMRAWFIYHLRRCTGPGGFPPQELPNSQQQQLPVGVIMSQCWSHGKLSHLEF